MKRLLSWILVSAGSATAAFAQPAPAPAPHATSARDLLALHDFARCVALGRPERARQLLVLDPADAPTAEQFSSLMVQSNECTKGELRGGALLFRGALAEVLLSRDLAGRTLAEATAFNPALPPLQARDLAEYMAMCLIRTRPAEVAALFGSRTGSDEERRALAVLLPHLAACVPERQTAAVNRHGLRAALAAAGYRLVHHNANTANATSGRR
jgi:hypothetical protein